MADGTIYFENGDKPSFKILEIEAGSRVYFRDGVDIVFNGETVFSFKTDNPGDMVLISSENPEMEIKAVPND